jgi:tetratricopeptide (TPR) repeat protein
MRAYELRRLHRDREALSVLDRVLATDPRRSRALNLRAMCLATLGESEAAIQSALASTAAAPHSDSAFWTLSLVLSAADRNQEAVEAAATAVRLDPNDWGNHTQLALCLAALDPAAAVEPAERARELAPERATTHVNCGLVYERAGRRDEARQAYERARAIDPQSSFAHLRIAQLDKGARKWDQALYGFRRAATLDPRSSRARREIEDLVLRRLSSMPVALAFGAALGAAISSTPPGSALTTRIYRGGRDRRPRRRDLRHDPAHAARGRPVPLAHPGHRRASPHHRGIDLR